MLQVIPSFFAKYSEKAFGFCKHIKKWILCKNYCIAHQDAHICFLPKCRYHIFLLGNVKSLVQELDVLCFAYQHVDCLFTLFKYRFDENVVVTSSKVFDNVQRAVAFTHWNRGVDRMPSIAKKNCWCENTERIELFPQDEINAKQEISLCRMNWTS